MPPLRDVIGYSRVLGHRLLARSRQQNAPRGWPGASWRFARRLLLRRNEFRHPGVEADAAGDLPVYPRVVRLVQFQRGGEIRRDGVAFLAA